MGLVFAKNKLPNSCEIFVEFTPFCKQSNALDPYFISQLGKIISERAIFYRATIFLFSHSELGFMMSWRCGRSMETGITEVVHSSILPRDRLERLYSLGNPWSRWVLKVVRFGGVKLCKVNIMNKVHDKFELKGQQPTNDFFFLELHLPRKVTAS